MLQSIDIQNYALIEALHLDFHPGFSVITGETGAGKSIILGAIGLLLGQRADVKGIRAGARRCTIEASFCLTGYGLKPLFEENDWEYDEEDCIIRREVYDTGKSRAFVNDVPASLAALRELGERLIDIHSQHQNLLLNHDDFLLNVLDTLSGNSQVLEAYHTVFRQWKDVQRQIGELKTRQQKSLEEEAYIRFQYDELEKARLTDADEQATLEQEASVLAHAEDIKSGLYEASTLLDGKRDSCLEQIRQVAQALQRVRDLYPAAEEWHTRIESTFIELKDIYGEISREGEDIEFDPQRLDAINERLNLLYALQQKHRVSSVGDLMALREQLGRQLEQTEQMDDDLLQLQQQQTALTDTLHDLCEALTRARQQAAATTEQAMQQLLIPLGMPNVRFEVKVLPLATPVANGQDAVSFLFSANRNVPLRNVAEIASGGEIARVMLSLKALLAGATRLPTIIFDEIDTGVSGSVADRMALMMKDMGRKCRQVISITHLPQIASRGQVHYKVYKSDDENGTHSDIRQLNEKERITEIANMLSGATLTPEAISNAQSLLTTGQND